MILTGSLRLTPRTLPQRCATCHDALAGCATLGCPGASSGAGEPDGGVPGARAGAGEPGGGVAGAAASAPERPPGPVSAPTCLKCAFLLCAGFLALWVTLVWLGWLLRSVPAERPAIGQLKAISSAQSLFREGDKDQDGVLDYGSLRDLTQHGLITAQLGTGVYEGYEYYVGVGEGPKRQWTWWALARPLPEGPFAGGRSFFTNQTGLIHYSPARIYLPDVGSEGKASSAWPLVGQ